MLRMKASGNALMTNEEILARYNKAKVGEISIEAFEDWFIPLSVSFSDWLIPVSGENQPVTDKERHHIIGSIDLALAERTGIEQLTDKEFFARCDEYLAEKHT